ncbi:hypothetical protein A3Q56_06788, partial [Intoshia linei]
WIFPLRIFFKLVTFIYNLWLIRHVNIAIIGLVNVRFELLYSTLINLSIQPFRRAYLSTKSHPTSVLQIRIKIVSYSIILSFLLGIMWYMLPIDSHFAHEYPFCIGLYLFSVLLQTFVEPYYIYFQLNLKSTLKISIENVSVLAKYIFVYILINSTDVGVLICFSMSQIAKTKLDIPIDLLISFTKQTIIKQILGECEKFIMTFFNILSIPQQGVYNVVSNFGSIITRCLFLPIEDSFYLYISRTRKRCEKAIMETKLSIFKIQLEKIYSLLLYISLIIVTFGWPNASIVLTFYSGKKFVNNYPFSISIFQMYIAYLPFLCINGITESYVFASISSTNLDKYNVKLAKLSIIFIICNIVFGFLWLSHGLVLAGYLNMICRIIMGFQYIEENLHYEKLNFFKRVMFGKHTTLVHIIVLIFLLINSFQIDTVSINLKIIIHCFLSGILLIMCLTYSYFTDDKLHGAFKQLGYININK